MTNMKRGLSDSENDDDVFDDDLKSGSPTQSCHVGHDRKKRRGVIEKRRRDRINNSLTELRRLVPAAFEKQGSAKLEKAEILQMTVDHLKILHSKGVNGYNLDTAALAMDYRSVGFRECAAEVARYLVAVEGVDIQDPMRLRLLSHLQCYSAQREAAAKASLTNTLQSSSWNHMATHHQYSSTTQTAEQLSMTSHTASPYPENSRMTQPHADNTHSAATMAASMRLPVSGASMSQIVSSSTGPQVALSGLPQVHAQFPVSLGMNSMTMLSPSGHYSAGTTTGSTLSQMPSSVKPYRPWGGELAY